MLVESDAWTAHFYLLPILKKPLKEQRKAKIEYKLTRTKQTKGHVPMDTNFSNLMKDKGTGI